MFTVFVLSGVLLLNSGAIVTITTRQPFETMALCDEAAVQARAFASNNGDVIAGSLECRPHDLPIPPANTEKLVPQQDAG